MPYAVQCKVNKGSLCASNTQECQCISSTATKQVYRVLRVLEYVGDREAIEASLKVRGVKGEREVDEYVIREAIIGDFPELLGKK